MNNILYEATSKFDFSILAIPAIMIIGMLIFPLIIKKSYKGKDIKLTIKIVKLFCLSGILFVALLSTVALIAQLNMYNKIVGAYSRGEYQIVEGYVENFKPMPYEGHANETFEINGVKFSYSDYNIIKIARRNINNLRYADGTTLMAENDEELRASRWKWKKRVKKLV